MTPTEKRLTELAELLLKAEHRSMEAVEYAKHASSIALKAARAAQESVEAWKFAEALLLNFKENPPDETL